MFEKPSFNEPQENQKEVTVSKQERNEALQSMVDILRQAADSIEKQQKIVSDIIFGTGKISSKELSRIQHEALNNIASSLTSLPDLISS